MTNRCYNFRAIVINEFYGRDQVEEGPIPDWNTVVVALTKDIVHVWPPKEAMKAYSLSSKLNM